MSIGFWQILIIVLLLVLLFGRGKISDLMGDVAQGIKSFKKGMSEDDADAGAETEAKADDARVIEHSPAEAAPKTTSKSAAKSKSGTTSKASATRKRKAS